MIQVKNRKNGKIGYVTNEGEKVTVEFEDGKVKEYTPGSFKRTFTKTGDIKINKEEGLQMEIKETTNETVEERKVNSTKVQSEVEFIKGGEEVAATEEVVEEPKEKTLVEKTIEVVESFVGNPNFDSSATRLEYIERKTISKVALNNRNLFEIDVQKKGVVFYFNTSQLKEENVKRMTKILSGYDWSSDGIYKVVSESQLDTLWDLMCDAYEGKLKADKEKAAKREAKSKGKRKTKETIK